MWLSLLALTLAFLYIKYVLAVSKQKKTALVAHLTLGASASGQFDEPHHVFAACPAV